MVASTSFATCPLFSISTPLRPALHIRIRPGCRRALHCFVCFFLDTLLDYIVFASFLSHVKQIFLRVVVSGSQTNRHVQEISLLFVAAVADSSGFLNHIPETEEVYCFYLNRC